MGSAISRISNNRPIAARFTAAVALPVLAMAGFALLLMIGQWRAAERMDRLNELTHFATRISDLVHEAQKERGMSAVFLNSGGQQLAAELPQQRQLTSDRIAPVRAAFAALSPGFYPDSVRNAIETAMGALPDLDAKRTAISGKSITGLESNRFFTDFIGRLLSVSREAVKSSDDPVMTASLLAYYSYVSAKERSGRERAAGAVGFAAGTFTAEQYRPFLTAVADQRSFFEAFDTYASQEQHDFARKTVQGPAVDEVDHDRQVALDTLPGDLLGGITGKAWYDAATARINLMKQVEDHLATSLLRLSEDAATTAWRRLTSEVIAVFAALLISLATLIWLARGITRPINAMAAAMHRLAGGDLGIVIPALGQADEIGQMADAMRVFKDNMVETARLTAEQAADRSAKDRKQSAMERHTQDFVSSVSGVMAALGTSADGMRQAASSMSEAATRVKRAAIDTTEGAVRSSQDLTSVAAAIEELTSSVDEISRQVTEAATVAKDAVRRVDTGQETMRGLSGAASRIGDVVQLIQGIAGQTNLLALNATIEAARAGDAGKGFAVVAGEVKALAGQTAKATAEIGEQIGTMRTVTDAAVAVMTDVGAIIGKISEVSAAISAAVEEQSATARELASSVQTVSSATAATARAMEDVSANAGNAGQVSQTVETSAADVSHQTEMLRGEVDEFLAAVRDETGNRRLFDRVAANGASVIVRHAGKPPVRMALKDISFGGAALLGDCPLALGCELTIELPNATTHVTARVARSEAGELGIVFRQDPATAAQVEKSLRAIGDRRPAA